MLILQLNIQSRSLLFHTPLFILKQPICLLEPQKENKTMKTKCCKNVKRAKFPARLETGTLGTKDLERLQSDWYQRVTKLNFLFMKQHNDYKISWVQNFKDHCCVKQSRDTRSTLKIQDSRFKHAHNHTDSAGTQTWGRAPANKIERKKIKLDRRGEIPGKG